MTISETPYSDNFDILIAVVTHLASADFGDYQGRSVGAIAVGLGDDFPEEKVKTTLDRFSGLFRKSAEGDYYNLHLRFSRRKKNEEGKYQTAPLEHEGLSTLIELISKMVAHEKEFSRLLLEQRDAEQRLSRDIRQRNWTLAATFVLALIAALASIAAALLTAFLKKCP